jgi:hypothetical protein
MELYKALKTVVDLQGKDILEDTRLINILSDFKAYEDIQASKIVLKNMQNEGLMAKLIREYNTSSNPATIIVSYTSLLSNNYGFQSSIAEYVLNCLAFAQGWIDVVPNISSQTADSKTFEHSADSHNDITDDGNHLLFKQFPIMGDVNSFINLLVANGYSLAEPYNNTYNAASLIGSFAGNNDCHIGVLGTPKSHIACTVMIFLQEHHIWYSIKDQYEKIKNQLSKKYGSPESYEYFLDPYYEGDGSELTALYSQHCVYISTFNTLKGKVSVSMTGDAKILIAYQDKINNEIKDSEERSIADDDL